jgi:hypothetical protein
MKTKYIITICILLLATLCINTIYAQSTAKKIDPAEAKKNQKADDEFLRALQTGDVSKLGDIADARFINHGVGEKIGPDSLKSSIKMFYSRFKPATVEIISRTTDGEYFGDWIRYVGSNPGVVVEGIEMTKYSNGKAVEHWFFPNNQRRANK